MLIRCNKAEQCGEYTCVHYNEHTVYQFEGVSCMNEIVCETIGQECCCEEVE